MITQQSRVYRGGITVVVLMLGVATSASGQTPLPSGLELRLLPGFTHERLKGEHGPTGKFTKKGGMEIHYVMAFIGKREVLTLSEQKAQQDKEAQPAGDKIKKGLAELQGVWRLRGFEVDGMEAILQDHKQIRWVIKEDRVFYGGDPLARLTLDPATNPRCVDLVLVKSKRVHEGIYKLEEDRLKICVSMTPDDLKERPLKFNNEGLEKFRTMLFERDKPGTELEGAAGFVGVQLRLDDKTKAIKIVETIKDSPAQKAGFKKDDVLLKVGSEAAEDLQQTIDLVRQLKPGSNAIMRVRRGDKEQDIAVKVGVAPFLFFDF